MASFRLADLYVERQAALHCLQEIQRQYPHTKYASAALERAQRLIGEDPSLPN